MAIKISEIEDKYQSQYNDKYNELLNFIDGGIISKNKIIDEDIINMDKMKLKLMIKNLIDDIYDDINLMIKTKKYNKKDIKKLNEIKND